MPTFPEAANERKTPTFTYRRAPGPIPVYEVIDDGKLIGTVRRVYGDMWRPLTQTGEILLNCRLRRFAALQLRAAESRRLYAHELATRETPQDVYASDTDLAPVGTVRYDNTLERWVGRTNDGTDLQVSYERRDNAEAAVVRRAAQIAPRQTEPTPPPAGPEKPDCRCAARLNIREHDHRAIHDVHPSGECPCVCHRRDGRDAETMPDFAQFGVGKLAETVVRLAMFRDNYDADGLRKSDAMIEAWCILTGLPRAQALHVAAEMAGRNTVAVTAPF